MDGLESHSSRILSNMNSLRRDRKLCDVVLRIGCEEIPAHRLVLSACSGYFCAMFTGKMLESRQEVVVLNDLDPAAVESIVEFMYTSKLHANEDNVQSLLKAGSILQLSEIVAMCCNFLSSQLDASNCLGIAHFAEAHGCSALEEAAVNFVNDNFTEVIQHREFVKLPPSLAVDLLNSEMINVKSEEEVYSAVHRWITHTEEGRRDEHAYKLLSCVRMTLLQPQTLAEMYSMAVFRKDPQCMDLIVNALVFHTVKKHLLEVSEKPRRSTLGTLFVIGGMETCRHGVSIECYNARREHWMLISTSQSACKRLQFGVAVLSPKLYMVGGRNGLRTLNSVDSYDPATNVWETVSPMCSFRHGVGVAVLGGSMYAVGGHDGWSYLNSVERYDPETQEWSHISPMLTPRSTAGVAVLEGRVYVVGGRDSNCCLCSVECYNPHTNRWASVRPMSVARGGLGVAALNGKLYAIGGHETSLPLHSAEVYDPKTSEWTSIAPLLCARDAVAVATYGGQLYAIGGFNGSTYLNSVEVYDAEKDQWSTSGVHLRHGRAGASIATMADFHVGSLPQSVL